MSRRAASFRGAPFEVDAVKGKFGRRLVDHEYPQRDKPYEEDLGRLGRELPVTAFVTGDDYEHRRDTLLERIERPGPGLLVHPTLGTLTVSVKSCDYTESKDEGRVARFELVFVESGDLTFPTLAIDTGAAVAEATGNVQESAASAFGTAHSTTGLPAYGVTQALTDAHNKLAGVRRSINGVVSAALSNPAKVLSLLGALEADVGSLIHTPAALALRVQGLLQQLDSVLALDTLLATAGLAKPAQSSSKTESQIEANTYATDRLFVQSALAAKANAIASTAFASHDEAVALQQGYTDQVQAELGVVDAGDLFAALVDTVAAVVDDVQARATDLARLVQIQPLGLVSTLELAERLYADADRADEIASRNAIEHPGFAGGMLQVLSQ